MEWVFCISKCSSVLLNISSLIGYTIQTHGSHRGGMIDAIQLETPKQLRNKEALPQYAADVATAIHQYLQLHYDSQVKTQAQL